MRAAYAPATTVGVATPRDNYQQIALTRPADPCYELFCDVERIPEWLAVVRSAMVTSRDARGRASEVAFLARLEHATIGYSCKYRYHTRDRRIAWRTPEGSRITIGGFAEFQPLGDKACMMTYSLDLDLPGLPEWSDPFFAGHAASATLSDFRDYVTRAL
jgi:uncharacterized membrane protein